jgi:hypothetical protein
VTICSGHRRRVGTSGHRRETGRGCPARCPGARGADPSFPRVTAHGLRHTAASLAISAGAKREGRSEDARARQCGDDAGRLRRSVRVGSRRGSCDCVHTVSTVGQFALAFDTENASTSGYAEKFVVPSVRFELTLYGF